MFNSTSKKHSKSSLFGSCKNNNENNEKSGLLLPTPYYFNLNNTKTESLEINQETTKINENSEKITKERKYQNNNNFFTTCSNNASSITNNSTRLSWIRSSILNKKYPSMTTFGSSSIRINLKPNKINQKSQSLDNQNKNNNDRESRKSIRSLQAKFASSSAERAASDDGGSSAMRLITKLDKYTTEELKEYRQIFNMFDADRSGAIGIEELESAITNLGMDSKQIDVEMLMREADKRGNHQIDFDEASEDKKEK
uniref:EF-hand domain-containing protein n=1 Tax=Meloidogyne hapla TaxID=6305 RepID=A0A1I8BY01_MELHA